MHRGCRRWLGEQALTHTITLTLTKTQVSPLAGSADDAAPAAEALKADGIPDKIIGEIPASGLIFKDIVKVSRFSDPKVQGVDLNPNP